MSTDRKVILYIASSLDGYITKPNDDLSFLSIVQQDGEDYGYSDFVKSVDTVILGRKTYCTRNILPKRPSSTISLVQIEGGE